MAGRALDNELITSCVESMLAYSRGEEITFGGETVPGKKRNFTESVELQIRLKNYDPVRDKKFKGAIELPFVVRPRLNLCILGTEVHNEEARALGLDCLNMEDMKKFKRNKKMVKELAAKYDGFLASHSLVRRIPRLLPGLNRAGKFPSVISADDTVESRVDAVKATIKFQLKKVICLHSAIGTVGQSAEELVTNVTTALTFLATLTKKRWQSIGSVVVKSTMGKPFIVKY